MAFILIAVTLLIYYQTSSNYEKLFFTQRVTNYAATIGFS